MIQLLALLIVIACGALTLSLVRLTQPKPEPRLITRKHADQLRRHFALDLATPTPGRAATGRPPLAARSTSPWTPATADAGRDTPPTDSSTGRRTA
jgi:hypothetical protein